MRRSAHVISCISAFALLGAAASAQLADTEDSLSLAADSPAAPRLEGAFLTHARGEMRRLSSGGWAFVFNPDAESGERLPPMPLLPCMQLAAMEQIAESSSSPASFSVNGQIFIYQGRGYLLPISHTTTNGRATSQPDAGRVEPPQAAPEPAESVEETLRRELGLSAPAEQVDVETLLQGLDEAAPVPTRPAPAPRAARDSSGGLLPEGALVSLRRGRAIRGSTSQWEFRMDVGADDPPGVDPPLTILPCQALEQIEELASTRQEGLLVRMSGRVFVYRGGNYLIPTLFIVESDRGDDLASVQ